MQASWDVAVSLLNVIETWPVVLAPGATSVAAGAPAETLNHDERQPATSAPPEVTSLPLVPSVAVTPVKPWWPEPGFVTVYVAVVDGPPG